MRSKIFQSLSISFTRWLSYLIILLIVITQGLYLPNRINFLRRAIQFAQQPTPTDRLRLAYEAADYDLLEWVAQTTPENATILLLTANPKTYGDPSYVLYHRALYHLYPRTIYWAAPVAAERYPAWWLETDLTEANLLDLVETHQITVVWADGFTDTPLDGQIETFDTDTSLIFLTEVNR